MDKNADKVLFYCFNIVLNDHDFYFVFVKYCLFLNDSSPFGHDNIFVGKNSFIYRIYLKKKNEWEMI